MSERVRVDLRVPVGLPIGLLADFIARCEDAGFASSAPGSSPGRNGVLPEGAAGWTPKLRYA